MESTNGPIFWSLGEKLCNFYQCRIHSGKLRIVRAILSSTICYQPVLRSRSYGGYSSRKRRMVPRAGLEPAHLAVRDFKSLVSTISPPRRGSIIYLFPLSQSFWKYENIKSYLQLLLYRKKCCNIKI